MTNLLKHRKVLRALLFQGDLMNTVNGGVSTTNFEVLSGKKEITIVMKNRSLPGSAFNYFISKDLLVVDTFHAYRHKQNETNEHLGYPTFIKWFRLPSFIDRKHIESSYSNGVFTLHLPYLNKDTAGDNLLDGIHLN